MPDEAAIQQGVAISDAIVRDLLGERDFEILLLRSQLRLAQQRIAELEQKGQNDA